VPVPGTGRGYEAASIGLQEAGMALERAISVLPSGCRRVLLGHGFVVTGRTTVAGMATLSMAKRVDPG
jgi:hypothetical protein